MALWALVSLVNSNYTPNQWKPQKSDSLKTFCCYAFVWTSLDKWIVPNESWHSCVTMSASVQS